VHLTEVHLETENSNNTATDQKPLFVLHWRGQNIYTLESTVLSLKTEQREKNSSCKCRLRVHS